MKEEAEIPIPPLLPTPKALAPNGSGLDPRSSRAFAGKRRVRLETASRYWISFSSVAELCGSCTF